MALIVAIEGLDASGKSTQAELLRSSLIDSGLSVSHWSFPRYDTFFGRQIGAFLRGTGTTTADEVDARSMALWFAMDRWDAMQQGVPDADVLILNRWTMSNAVYQGARTSNAHSGSDPMLDLSTSHEMFDWVLRLETEVLGLPRPDVAIVLELSVAESMQRARARAHEAGEQPDLYETHTQLLERSHRLYQRAVDLGFATAINAADRTAEDIQVDVARLVRDRLKS
jgi:dTMP kinase